MLEELGLSSDAAALYRMLLSRGPTELAVAVAVAPKLDGDVVEAAAELRSMGLLIRPDDTCLTPVAPQVASRILVARQEAEVEEMKRRLEVAQAAADDLVAAYANPAAPRGGDVEHVIGAEAIWKRLAELTHEIQHEIVAFNPSGRFTPEAVEASREPNRVLLERGVRSRTVYLNGIRQDETTLEHAEWLRRHGSEVRTSPTLPVRMMVHDERLAIFPIDPANARFGIAVVREVGVIVAARALFEQVWDTAVPLGDQPAPDDHGLTPDERAALKLLADGLTDEAIARRLAVSPRTARRLTSGLVERLGARSRFEAGVLAARRGWLD